MNEDFKALLVDNHLYRYYVYFLQYIVIAEFCHADKNSIDVGCFRGQNTFAMAKQSRKVYAFDPLNDIIHSVKNKPAVDNFLDYLIWPDNDLMNKIEYYQLGLGNKNEVKDFFVYDKRSRSSVFELQNTDFKIIEKNKIEIKTIDDFNFENVSFIKINAEGNDYDVVKGGKKLIANQKPVFMLEFISSENPFADQDLTLINELNYKYYKVIPEYDNLEFILFHHESNNINSLIEKINQFNEFYIDIASKVLDDKITRNKFKLLLVDYFKKYY